MLTDQFDRRFAVEAQPLAAGSTKGGHLALLLVAIALTTIYRIAVIDWLALDPYVDEAYYWGWAQSLDWGYYSKPPLIAALIRLSETLLGDGLLALKLPSLVLHGATSVAIYLLGRSLFPSPVAFAASLAYLFLPLTAVLSLFVSTDAPLLFLWSISMWLLWRTRSDDGWLTWAALGLCIGLGLMAKYSMAVFVPLAVAAMLADPFLRRHLQGHRPLVALGVALLVFSPNIVWNMQHGGATYEHVAHITRATERGWAPDELLGFVAAQWLSIGPLLCALFLWALSSPRTLLRNPATRFALIMSVPLFVLVAIQALTGRANGNWAAPALIGTVLLTCSFALDRGRGRLLALAIAVNIALGLTLYHWPQILRTAGLASIERLDPYARARGWSELVSRVAPTHAAHPGAALLGDDRETLAHLIYGLRPDHYLRWAPPGVRIPDHYALTVPLREDPQQALIYVTARASPETVTKRFETATRLDEIVIEASPGTKRRFEVWRLEGFRSYTDVPHGNQE